MDLTVDEAPSKTSTVNTSVNIYNVLSAKRQKRGTDTRSKLTGGSLSGRRTNTTSEVHHTEDNSNGKSKEAPDFDVVDLSSDDNFNARDNRAPAAVASGNSFVNDDVREVDSIETSDSQRPKLSRFQRFTRRTVNGFISARVASTTAVSQLS